MGVGYPQLPDGNPTAGTPENPNSLAGYPYGAVTLYGPGLPPEFGFPVRGYPGASTPHLPVVTHGDLVWASPLSVAPTQGIAFAFFSCGY